MNIEDLKIVDTWLAKLPTLETIEKYAKYELKKNGYFQPTIIMKKDDDAYLVTMTYKNNEERNITKADLKEIIHKSKIFSYWLIRQMWSSSNPNVSENLDKNKTEALVIAEYKYNKKAKILFLNYETKDDKIVFGERIEQEACEKDAWNFYKGYEPKPENRDPAYC